MYGAQPVARGCGTRVKGGVYLEVGLGPNGLPIEAYIVDPPATLPDGFMLNPRGVHEQLDERTGVYHILDWVGAESYPYPTDFTEEVARYGMSRRIDRTFNFELITPKSLWLGVHPRAYIRNWQKLASILNAAEEEGLSDQFVWCPRELYRLPDREPALWSESRYNPKPHTLAGHPFPPRGLVAGPLNEPTMCAGLWWHVLSNDDEKTVDEEDTGEITRVMPSFTYKGWRPPEDFMPVYDPAFFLRFPLTRLVVVNDPDDPETIKKTYASMCRSSLPVEVVDQ